MMNTPRVIVPPTIEPLTLIEAKAHLRVTNSAEDVLIESYISAARIVCESAQGFAYYEQTLEWSVDQWPYGNGIILPRATPLISVDSVKYKDFDGVETTWASTEYIVDTDSQPGGVYLKSNTRWPISLLYPTNAIRVRYVAGKQTTSPVTDLAPFPENVRQAMRLLIWQFYDERSTVQTGTAVTMIELPNSVARLLEIGSIQAF